MIKKRIILAAVCVIITACLLVHSWTTMLIQGYTLNWRNITAIVLFVPIPYLLYKNHRHAALFTAVYLLLATMNVISLVPGVSSSYIGIGSVEIGGFNWTGLGLLILHGILNIDTFIDIQLDYAREKERKRTASKTTD